MLRLNADLLVGQVNVELHACRKKGNWDVRAGSRTPPPTGTKRSTSVIVPVTPGPSPGARGQPALSVLGPVSMAGSVAGSSVCEGFGRQGWNSRP